MQKQIQDAQLRAQKIFEAKQRNEEIMIHRMKLKQEKELELINIKYQNQRTKELEKQRKFEVMSSLER